MDIASIFHRLTGERSTAPGTPDATGPSADFASLLQILRGVLPPRREIAAAKAGPPPGTPAAPLTGDAETASGAAAASSPGTQTVSPKSSQPPVESAEAERSGASEPLAGQSTPNAESHSAPGHTPVTVAVPHAPVAAENGHVMAAGATATSEKQHVSSDGPRPALRAGTSSAEPGAAPHGHAPTEIEGAAPGASGADQRTQPAQTTAPTRVPSAHAPESVEAGSSSPVPAAIPEELVPAPAHRHGMNEAAPEQSRPARSDGMASTPTTSTEAQPPRTADRPTLAESPEQAPPPARISAQEPTVSPEAGFSQESDSPENPARHTGVERAAHTASADGRRPVANAVMPASELPGTTEADAEMSRPESARAVVNETSDADQGLDRRDTRSVLQMGRLRTELNNARSAVSGQEGIPAAGSTAPPATDSVESTRQPETTRSTVETDRILRASAADGSPAGRTGSTLVDVPRMASMPDMGNSTNRPSAAAPSTASASGLTANITVHDGPLRVSAQAHTKLESEQLVKSSVDSASVEQTKSTPEAAVPPAKPIGGAVTGAQSARTALSAILHLLQGDGAPAPDTRSAPRAEQAGSIIAPAEAPIDQHGMNEPAARVPASIEPGAHAAGESVASVDPIADQPAASMATQADLAPEAGMDRGSTRHTAVDVRPTAADAPRPGAFGQAARAAALWMDAVMTRPAAYHTESNGTSVLRLRIDEEAGAVTLRTRRDGDRMVVQVAFTDPTLQASAQSQGDEIRAALQQLFDSAVDLSFAQQDRPQEGQQADSAAHAARSLRPEVASTATEPEPVRTPRISGLAGARYEWVG